MRLLVLNAGSSSLKFDLVDWSVPGAARRLKTGAFVERADGSGTFALETAPPVPPLPAAPLTAAPLLPLVPVLKPVPPAPP